jgi:hypothetical protein
LQEAVAYRDEVINNWLKKEGYITSLSIKDEDSEEN